MITHDALRVIFGRCSADDGCLVIVEPTRDQVHACYSLGSDSDLEEAARDIAGKHGLYWKSACMNYASMVSRAKRTGRNVVGSMAEVQTVVGLTADVDVCEKSDKYPSRFEAELALSRMPELPTLVANTHGESGGMHAYWLLDSPVRIENEAHLAHISSVSRRWQAKLAEKLSGKLLDATFNLDRLLRVIGQKRSADGPVVDQFDRISDAFYSLETLTLPPTQKEHQQARRERQKAVSRSLLGDLASSSKPIEQYIRSAQLTTAGMLENAGYTQLSAMHWVHPASETGSRSVSLATNREDGLNAWSSSCEFDPLDSFGRPGRYYNREAVYVHLVHAGDWQAAAAFCKSAIASSIFKSKNNNLLERKDRSVLCHGKDRSDSPVG